MKTTSPRTGDEPEPRRPAAGGERMAGGAPGSAESFGTWLRRQRLGREIDLREIADTTRISLRYLQALEEDRFDVLPAPVFAKGFLRQYAKFVGLDPEDVVNFFEAARRADETHPPVEPARARRAARAPASWTYAAVFVLVAAALVALVAWLSHLDRRRRSEQEAPPSAASALTTPAPVPVAPPPPAPEAAVVEPSAPAPVAPPPAATAALEVTLDFRDRCWVEAWSDGRRQVSELRVQGESLKVEATREVVIKIGDIRVVDIEVNGHPVAEPSGAGVVRWLRFRRDALEGVAPGESVTPLPVDGEARAAPSPAAD